MKLKLINVLNEVFGSTFVEYIIYSNGGIRIKKIGSRSFKREEWKEADEFLIAVVRSLIMSIKSGLRDDQAL